MTARMYYDNDADPRALDGQTVAIIGYGSQGHAHARNLHESGVDVVVGLKPGSKSRAVAEEAGLRVADVAVEQAAKQLYRLIDVLKVQDVTSEPTVDHELALVKIRATDSNRAEILTLVELSKGRVVDLAGESVVVEVTGPEHEVDGFVALVRGYGIKEIVRTGSVVMSRGSSSIEEAVKR